MGAASHAFEEALKLGAGLILVLVFLAQWVWFVVWEGPSRRHAGQARARAARGDGHRPPHRVHARGAAQRAARGGSAADRPTSPGARRWRCLHVSSASATWSPERWWCSPNAAEPTAAPSDTRSGLRPTRTSSRRCRRPWCSTAKSAPRSSCSSAVEARSARRVSTSSPPSSRNHWRRVTGSAVRSIDPVRTLVILRPLYDRAADTGSASMLPLSTRVPRSLSASHGPQGESAFRRASPRRLGGARRSRAPPRPRARRSSCRSRWRSCRPSTATSPQTSRARRPPVTARRSSTTCRRLTERARRALLRRRPRASRLAQRARAHAHAVWVAFPRAVRRHWRSMAIAFGCCSSCR